MEANFWSVNNSFENPGIGISIPGLNPVEKLPGSRDPGMELNINLHTQREDTIGQGYPCYVT